MIGLDCGMDPETKSYLQAMEACASDLDRWRVRVGSLEVPQNGSQLHADDRIFPFHRISETARQTLASAGEHLRLAWIVIEGGHLFPSSHFTVLRGALAGAAQAVWMLDPVDDLERRDRGHQVIQEMYVQLRKFQQTNTTLHDLASAELQTVLAQIAWIDERLASLAAVRSTNRPLNQTDYIAAAAKIMYTDVGKQDQVRLLWRQMSCDAHVLGWSMWMRGQTGPTSRTTGLSTGTVTGDVGQIAQPFIASFDLLKRGWSLYDQRCEGS